MGTYFPDDVFEPRIPDEGESLWRYIDFTQFISIIEENELWLSASSNFTDKWEGGLTREQIERIASNLPKFIKKDEQTVERIYDALRGTTFVSCWHLREEETAAMWELYNDRGKEVAIKTNVDNLNESIEWSKDMTAGCVEYKNYDDGGELFPITRESPFFHKRSSFKHEHEYRIVKSEFNLPDPSALDDSLKEAVREKSGRGRRVSVEPTDLIHEIVISPVVGGWMRGLVQDVLDTYELEEIQVRESKLGTDPFNSQSE